MKRVGIFGGTFNPIHIGHLILAEEFLSRFSLEKIFFVPSGIPPHKKDKFIVDKEHRYKMVLLAISDNENFVVSDFEKNKKELSYTYLTLRYFKEKYFNSKIYVLMGLDSLLEIKFWKNWEEILDDSKVVVFFREGYNEENLDPFIKDKVEYIDDFKINISSSDIRERIKNKKPFRYFLHPRVYEYIIHKGLYR